MTKVKLVITLAIISALLLVAFLLLRPRVGEIGTPTAPDTSGRARRHLPDGTATAPEAGRDDSSAAPVPDAEARAGIERLDSVEKIILELVNENRRKAGGGLQDLSLDETLQQIARNHSDDMLARHFFDHVNPDGLAPADRIALGHRRLVGLTGENIWMGSGYDARDARKIAELIVKGWMESPGHRANILRPEYTHLGVGVSFKGGELRATQNFALVRALLDEPVPLQVKNGDALRLRTTPGAERYDFWLSGSGVRAGDSSAINDLTVRVNPGTYKLRFYFPTSGGYDIFMGPQVEVK
jgi:uncharacterized protein YkwD